MSLLFVQLLSGLANAMFLFLIASGLSLIFGVTRIVNFAHGSFYMLAAYLTYSLAAVLPGGPVAFYAAVFFLVNATYIALIWKLIDRTSGGKIPLKVRRIMRVRSLTTLSLFGAAAVVALKYRLSALESASAASSSI